MRSFARYIHVAAFLLSLSATASAASVCAEVFASRPHADKRVADAAQYANVRALLPTLSSRVESTEMAAKLIDFAELYSLPLKTIEVGPTNRRVKRLMVGLDVTDAKLVKAYLSTFNIDTPVGANTAGTIAIEAERELPGAGYAYVGVRTGARASSKKGFWRYGKQNYKGDPGTTSWWANPAFSNYTEADGKPSVVKAFGHLIALNSTERANVEYFLTHPEERGPCKTNNCIAWATGIELGKTSKDGTDESRGILFNKLGVSRSIAHFEIASRLMHAANDMNVATVAFVKGSEGLKQFRERDDLLPPEPKMPYPAIIPGLGYAKDAPVMKAISQIKDGARIFIPIAAGASPEAVAALVQNSVEMKSGYSLDVLVNGVSESTYQKGLKTTGGKFKLRALFLGGNLRKLHKEGLVDVHEGYLSDFTRWMRDPERTDFKYDTIIVRVAPKDEHGHYSLGPNNDMIMTILRDHPGIQVIAEVNPNVPRTIGNNFIVDKQISGRFESHSQLAGPATVMPNETDARIGRYLGELISSDAYLQVGIGNVFGGFAQGLKEAGKERIRIRTEMMGDAQMDMLKNGNAVSAETGFVYGTADLYKFIDMNPKVHLVETEDVNDPGTVSKLPKFHAVNTALQVNLRGDVNATHGDGFRMSSPGGQVEFMSGAARSAGGKAIIAIRSQVKGISTITLQNYMGTVTTPGASVTHVVTEYGVATISGVSEIEKAARLISVAYPAFRAQLISEAIRMKLLTPERAAQIPKD